MYSAFLLRERSRTFCNILERSRTLYHLNTVRLMGGGPRTFPGGINKWQWKRLHEKKAQEKERKLLEQEKQLYHARIRSQIRTKLAPNTEPKTEPGSGSGYEPMSPDDQVKALADRFMKEGAEDLWNEDDGPLKFTEPVNLRTSKPIDLRGLVSENRVRNVGSIGFSGVPRKRDYSVRVQVRRFGSKRVVRFRKKESSESESNSRSTRDDFGNVRFARNDSSESESVSHSVKKRGSFGNKGMRFAQNESSESENESDSEVGSVKKRGSFGNKGIRFAGNERLEHNLVNKRGNLGKGDMRFAGNERSEDGLVNKRGSFGNRGMKFAGNESSESESESDLEDGLVDKRGNMGKGVVKRDTRIKFARNESDSSEDDDDSDDDADYDLKKKNVRKEGSSASLRKYDVKITKRVPLKDIEKESNFGDEVEFIRSELARKKLEEEELEIGRGESILSEKRFDVSGISPRSVRALTEAGFIQMTRVQEATLSVCLEGKDALIKSRSGTGKSAAFLLPAIETVLEAATGASTQRISPIVVLILCPTRELASQIAAEANALLRYHDGVGVQTLVGGTRFKIDQKRLESDPCQIIVATPGRLLDHLEARSGLSVRLMKLKMLIVDEADHLLDLGFRKDIEKIVDCVPRQRHSLLFSATIPKEVRRVSQLILKRDHVYIDTVGLGGVETPAKIKQSFVVAPHESHFQIVHHFLSEHVSRVPDYKVIVFCTTGMVTSLLYLLLREMKMNVMEMHSRKPQLHRARISEEFRESKQQILVTSDVSARGMNYPDVTLVIQVGIPTDREQYIHRIGRTGRGGKDGEGILLLAPWEEYFVDEVDNLPLEKFPSPNIDPSAKLKIENSMAKIDGSSKEAAYHAWLGYYNSIKEIGRDKTTLVELANRFSQSIGLERSPTLFRKTAVKMGLKDIPGIRIRK